MSAVGRLLQRTAVSPASGLWFRRSKDILLGLSYDQNKQLQGQNSLSIIWDEKRPAHAIHGVTCEKVFLFFDPDVLCEILRKS